jgi:phospholipase/lecithinase/hemolysin
MALGAIGLAVSGSLSVTGGASFGPSAGAAVDSGIYLDSTSFHNTIIGRHWTAGVPTTGGSIDFFKGWGILSDVPTGLAHRFRINNADSLTVTATGVQVAGSATVADEAYGGAWDGSLQVPTKNAVYDKIQSLGGGANDTAYGPSWDGSTTVAPSQNAVYDKLQTLGTAAVRNLSVGTVAPGSPAVNDLWVDTN